MGVPVLIRWKFSPSLSYYKILQRPPNNDPRRDAFLDGVERAESYTWTPATAGQLIIVVFDYENQRIATSEVLTVQP